MKYRINVKETNYGCIEIEADSEAEAYEKAEGAYFMGQTIWDQGNYELSGAQPIQDRNRGEAR